MGMEWRRSNVGLRGLSVNDFLGRYSRLGISWFEPSSMMKVVLYRGFETGIEPFNHLVGQHEGKVVDLLENSEYNVRYLHAFILKTI